VKSRKRPAQHATPATPRVSSTWIDLFRPGDLPEHGRPEDLASIASNAGALREASRVFGGRGGRAQAAELDQEPALDVAATEPQALSPRVLPDLVAAAREQERVEAEALEARKRRHASKGSIRKPQRKRVAADDLKVVVTNVPSIDHAPPCPAPAFPKSQ
jgi:hypothetical protein